MKTYKVIQLMVAGALALALNGVAVAQSLHLNASATGSIASTGLVPGPSLHTSTDGLIPSQPSFGKFGHGDLDDRKVPQCAPVPEPSVYLLMLAGVGLIGFMSYRRQRYLMSNGQVLSST